MELKPKIFMSSSFYTFFFFVVSSLVFNISEAASTQKPHSRTRGSHETTSLTVTLKPIDTLVCTAYNITSDTLFNLKLKRDRKKVQSLSDMVSARGIQEQPTFDDDYDFEIPVISGHLDKRLFSQYYTELSIGTPPVKYMFTVDTGSGITWMQCLPCINCFDQVSPTFNQNQSASFSVEGCSDYTLCQGFGGCNEHGECKYNISYGGGSYSRGVMAIDIFTVPWGDFGEINMLIPFGCGRNNSRDLVGDGILGLGRGPVSFPSQVNRQFGFDKFSYCLADKLDTRTNASSLTFGFYVSDEPEETIYTPLIRGTSPFLVQHYVINLVGITVADKQLQVNSTSFLNGVAVDSGCTQTIFPRHIYEDLRDIVRIEALRLGWKPMLGNIYFDTCFNFAGNPRQIDDAPTVILHFEGDANVELKRHNVMFCLDPDTCCLGFLPTDRNIAILGNTQQQGIRVVYDLSKSTIGFVPNSC